MYKQILRDTFASVFENKDSLFKALIIPAILLIIFQHFMSDIEKIYTGEIINYYLLIPSIILTIIFNITIAITTHRILILGNDSIPTWGIFKLSSRELTFAGKFILIILSNIAFSILLIICTVVLFFIVNSFIEILPLIQSLIPLSSLLIIIISFSILAGLFLVLPATATENKLSMKKAWMITKKKRFLCFVTIILFPNLFGTIFGFVYGTVIAFLVKLISPELNVLYPILNVFISVFTISALSHTYKYLIKNNEDSSLEHGSKQEQDLLIENKSEEEQVETILQTLPSQDSK